MRLILIGTAPALASAEQDHIYLLLDGPAGCWLIDCGGSAAHQMLRRGYDPLSLRGIILTHGHADHLYGLPVFIQDLWLRGRREPLPIYGNAPTIERARAVLELFIYAPMRAFVEYHVMSETPSVVAFVSDDFTLRTTPTIHSFPCHALRFEPNVAARVIVYSADTAPCANVVSLARGADVLIHEATVLEPVGVEIGHSTAAEAARVAVEAGAGELWLVHSNPALYSDGETHLREARKIFGGTIYVARDGDRLEF
ncbi:MAG: MBL fold metallo-hydrolase [Chloroflexota bacterium]